MHVPFAGSVFFAVLDRKVLVKVLTVVNFNLIDTMELEQLNLFLPAQKNSIVKVES